MPCKRTVHRIANRFQMTGSMLDIYIYIKLCWLLEGMVSKSSADKAWNVLKVCPCNIRALQQFFPLDQEVRSWYPMDFLIQIGVFSDEYWFILNRTVNNLSNRYWYSENLYAVNVPLYNFKVGVWYTMSAHKITGHLFFKDTVNSEHYVWLILTPFFRDLQLESVQLLFVGTIERQSWYRQSLQEFKEKLLIFEDELCHVVRNIFRRCEAWLEAVRGHFMTLQWNMVSWTPGTKMDSKFPEDTGLLCDKGPVTAAMLRDMIRGTRHRNDVKMVDWKYTSTVFIRFV